ncbi:MAG: MotA/TolQ/ExbB proton channel family protein [Bacteroidetes bacterium]|jgi:biopolymer transport protein ExbB|nr:MotA/TolQ/ExbB proton channel family protein [Bacteroidota bacterium]
MNYAFMLNLPLRLQMETPTPPASLNVLDLAFKGGPFMIPLLAFSILTVYLMVERSITLKRYRRGLDALHRDIQVYIKAGQAAQAIETCKRSDLPLARLYLQLFEKRPTLSMESMREHMDYYGKKESVHYEKNLAMMATVSGAAPMVGFLGTVTGMIRAFYQMSISGASIDPSKLSGGIYEAMVTTAAGLMVGILAYLAYNYFTVKVERQLTELEFMVGDTLELTEKYPVA